MFATTTADNELSLDAIYVGNWVIAFVNTYNRFLYIESLNHDTKYV